MILVMNLTNKTDITIFFLISLAYLIFFIGCWRSKKGITCACHESVCQFRISNADCLFIWKWIAKRFEDDPCFELDAQTHWFFRFPNNLNYLLFLFCCCRAYTLNEICTHKVIWPVAPCLSCVRCFLCRYWRVCCFFILLHGILQ